MQSPHVTAAQVAYAPREQYFPPLETSFFPIIRLNFELSPCGAALHRIHHSQRPSERASGRGINFKIACSAPGASTAPAHRYKFAKCVFRVSRLGADQSGMKSMRRAATAATYMKMEEKQHCVLCLRVRAIER